MNSRNQIVVYQLINFHQTNVEALDGFPQIIFTFVKLCNQGGFHNKLVKYREAIMTQILSID
jgi:hypothetical protein